MAKRNKSSTAPTSFRLNAELLKRVQHECIDRGVSQTAAIEAGLRWWLSSGDPSQFRDKTLIHEKVEGELTEEGEIEYASGTDWHIVLDRVLDSSHPVAIEAITRNLHAFDVLIHSDKAGTKKGYRVPELTAILRTFEHWEPPAPKPKEHNHKKAG